jgi:hypothetical protein
MREILRVCSYWMMALGVAMATEPTRVVLDSYADFATGLNRSTTLSEDGFLEVAPLVTSLAELKADQIWSILPRSEGVYLVGTSPEGKLFQVLAGGQVLEVHKFEGTHLYALAKNAKGEVFVAVSPEGKIYKLSANEKPQLYFDTKQKYVWDLVIDKAGVMYAATGIEGKVYKITGAGKGDVFYDTDEVHLRSLALDEAGQLWMGSAETGLLYRVSPKGEAVVMASTGRQEVNRIAVGTNGEIYFAATGLAKPAAPITKPPAAAGAASLPSVMPPLSGEGGADPAASVLGGRPGSGLRASGEGSQLWKLEASGFAEVIWATKETILTLDARDKGVYAGTASEGYQYRINGRGRATRLLKVEGAALSATAFLSSERWLAGASNPAALFLVGGNRAEPGVYESRVVDSGLFARWGTVRVQGQGRFEARTRSGNTPKPDKSWHGWVPVQEEQSKSPAARFLQVEVRLNQGSVDRVELVYLPRNVAPKLDQIEILPPGYGYLPIMPPPVLPQAKSPEQLLNQSSSTSMETAFRPQVRFQPIVSRGLRTVTWRALDPNGDDLRYTVSYRAAGSQVWRVLDKDIEEAVSSWDTSGWPDGDYYLKILASDALANAPSEVKTDELESKLFTVDNTAPKIQILTRSATQTVFTVTDEASGLQHVTVSKDGKEFQPVRPFDGILDSRSERFEVMLGKSDVLFIRAEDQAGNVSSALAEP